MYLVRAEQLQTTEFAGGTYSYQIEQGTVRLHFGDRPVGYVPSYSILSPKFVSTGAAMTCPGVIGATATASMVITGQLPAGYLYYINGVASNRFGFLENAFLKQSQDARCIFDVWYVLYDSHLQRKDFLVLNHSTGQGGSVHIGLTLLVSPTGLYLCHKESFSHVNVRKAFEIDVFCPNLLTVVVNFLNETLQTEKIVQLKDS